METPTRSQSLWLEDGNVVIQAEATQFKVYRGLLALHSPIFKDMFTLPQPPSGEQLVEGCPVVRLSDAAADVSIVLETICLRKWVASGEPLPLEVITAFLRLGSKYEIEALRSEALNRLFFEFPSDLAGIDKVFFGEGSGTMIKFEVDWKFIDFVNLGQRRTDNTISTLHPVNERACLRAYLEILKLKHITFDWLICPQSCYSGCTSRDRCSVARDKLLKSTFFPVALRGWINTWRVSYEIGQCNACILVAKRLHNSGRQKAWDALPGAFGLPAWEELNEERPSSPISI